MEVIDIGLNDLEPISLDIDQNSSSGGGMNFGPGIELLMNDKKKSSGNINIDLGNLDSLENELNELSGNTNQKQENVKSVSGLGSFAQNWFGIGGGGDKGKSEPPIQSSHNETDSNLGQATHETMGNTKTWDGFSKMNEIPSVNAPKMNERERRRKKRAMIKKLEEWYEKGIIKNNSHFNMESNYEEVEDE